MLKEILLQTSISDLSEELRGYSHVLFVDWEPDIFLSFSFGDGKSRPVRKGMRVTIHPDMLIYKISKLPVKLQVELS